MFIMHYFNVSQIKSYVPSCWTTCIFLDSVLLTTGQMFSYIKLDLQITTIMDSNKYKRKCVCLLLPASGPVKCKPLDLRWNCEQTNAHYNKSLFNTIGHLQRQCPSTLGRSPAGRVWLKSPVQPRQHQ